MWARKKNITTKISKGCGKVSYADDRGVQAVADDLGIDRKNSIDLKGL